MELEDFLRVFGNWKVEIKSLDGKVKEFKVRELYEIFNQNMENHEKSQYE